MIILELLIVTALVLLIILYLLVKSSGKSKPITNAKVDSLEQLKKLKELRNMDAISEEEYQEKKQKVLEKHNWKRKT